MYIILGATGHVGSAVARSLLDHGEKVTVVTRSGANAAELRSLGAKIAEADVRDRDTLKEIFNAGKRLFLLNPPADPAGNMEQEEGERLDCILQALEASHIEQVVAQSTYGAQAGNGIADLGVLHRMEQRLKAMPITSVIIRGAYYMSNWDHALKAAAEEGIVHTLFPVHFQLPMVAPQDLGEFAASQLVDIANIDTDSGNQTILHMEGPETYSATDVALAIGDAIDEDVKAVQIPKDKWVSSMMRSGFSAESAESFRGMTELTLRAGGIKVPNPHRGSTNLSDYFMQRVGKHAHGKTIR